MAHIICNQNKGFLGLEQVAHHPASLEVWVTGNMQLQFPRIQQTYSQTLKIGNSKNGNSVFSLENNSMLASFSKKFVTQQVTSKMSKQCMSFTEKLNFFFFFSIPYFSMLLTLHWCEAEAVTPVASAHYKRIK